MQPGADLTWITFGFNNSPTFTSNAVPMRTRLLTAAEVVPLLREEMPHRPILNTVDRIIALKLLDKVGIGLSDIVESANFLPIVTLGPRDRAIYILPQAPDWRAMHLISREQELADCIPLFMVFEPVPTELT